MAAIGKNRKEAQKIRRQESGVRSRVSRDHGVEQASAAPSSAARGATAPPTTPSVCPPPPSGERGETIDPSTAEDAAAIVGLLDQTSQRLLRMTDTPLRRDLASLVERYRRAVGEWAHQTGTPLQRVILFDCVKALHDRVVLRSKRDPSR